MSIFKSKNINAKALIGKISKIVNLVNADLGKKDNQTQVEERTGLSSSKDDYRTQVEERYGLSKEETKFVKAVSDDMTDDEVEQLKAKISEDDSVIKNYRNRSMLKDAKSGKLLPKSNFAVDVNYPARGFRAISTNS
jgi:LPS O-antigen subunit length determinant protein (WzzB/FepE family)